MACAWPSSRWPMQIDFGLCADPVIVGDLDPIVGGILAEASALRHRCDVAGTDNAMEMAGT